MTMGLFDMAVNIQSIRRSIDRDDNDTKLHTVKQPRRKHMARRIWNKMISAAYTKENDR